MKLVFAGDFVPLDGFTVQFDDQVRDVFKSADFSIANLECPLTNAVQKITKSGPCLKARQNQIEQLVSLGVNCVTLANNHIRDYSDSGVVDTLHICKNFDVQTVGAGENAAAARRFLLLKKGNESVVIVNAAENEFNIAGENSAGANPIDLINLLRDIASARKVSKNVVLILHGGREHVNIPSPESVRLLRFLAEQEGVVAVIRHHPHVIQGKEIHFGVPIYYSLGNFYIPQKKERAKAWWEGLIVELQICDNAVRCREIKVKVSRSDVLHFQIGIDSAPAELPTLDEAEARNVWREEFKRNALTYKLNLIYPWPYFVLRLLRKCGAGFLVRPNPIAQCYLRCDAHLEMLRHAIGASTLD